jgi:chitinase
MTVAPGHTGSNVGGLRGDFHHVRLTLPSWQSIAPGAFAELTLDYKLPLSGPSNYTLTFGGQTYNLAINYSRGGVAPTGSPTVSPTVSATVSASPTGSPPACSAPAWNPATAYNGGAVVSYNGRKYTARWWTQGNRPDQNSGEGQPWRDDGPCGGTTPPSPSVPPSVSPSASPSRSPSLSVQPTGQYPAWTTGVAYTVGTRVSYQGRNYQCRQPHTSLPGWDPVSAPALWLAL